MHGTKLLWKEFTDKRKTGIEKRILNKNKKLNKIFDTYSTYFWEKLFLSIINKKQWELFLRT